MLSSSNAICFGVQRFHFPGSIVVNRPVLMEAMAYRKGGTVDPLLLARPKPNLNVVQGQVKKMRHQDRTRIKQETTYSHLLPLKVFFVGRETGDWSLLQSEGEKKIVGLGWEDTRLGGNVPAKLVEKYVNRHRIDDGRFINLVDGVKQDTSDEELRKIITSWEGGPKTVETLDVDGKVQLAVTMLAFGPHGAPPGSEKREKKDQASFERVKHEVNLS